MNAFDQKKTSILLEITTTSEESPDASPKGTIDELCLPIINLINSHPDMVTTSLCSGRVSVFLEGNKVSTQIGAKGNEGRWLFVTHNPAELDGWYNGVDFVYDSEWTGDRYILYKFEPLILHVKCRDHKTASLLYSTAMGCGFRESGIGSNDIVGIRILIKLDAPIGCLNGDNLVLFVLKEYLELLTQLSHARFTENFKKMDQLHKAIESMGSVEEEKVEETKEERRLRKMKEGMERRDGVRQEKEKIKAEKARKAELEAAASL